MQRLDVRRFEVLEYPNAIDLLPPRSVILNGLARSRNYEHFGANLNLRVIGYSQATKTYFDPSRSVWRFDADTLGDSDLDFVHLYSDAVVECADGLKLVPIAVDDTNPFNGIERARPTVLYRLAYSGR